MKRSAQILIGTFVWILLGALTGMYGWQGVPSEIWAVAILWIIALDVAEINEKMEKK